MTGASLRNSIEKVFGEDGYGHYEKTTHWNTNYSEEYSNYDKGYEIIYTQWTNSAMVKLTAAVNKNIDKSIEHLRKFKRRLLSFERKKYRVGNNDLDGEYNEFACVVHADIRDQESLDCLCQDIKKICREKIGERQ